MAGKVNRVSVRFHDSLAVRLLTARPTRWRPEDDPDWRRLRREYFRRQNELLRQLAANFKIGYRPRTRAFWKALSLRLVGLFPVQQFLRETRGRTAVRLIPEELFEEISRSTGKEMAVIYEIALREGVPDSTLGRRYREWKRRRAKSGRNL